MKKLLALVLALALTLSLVACGGGNDASGEGDGKYVLALVTDQGSIDDRSFNQGAWEGLKQYAEENNITYNYYRPVTKDTDGYITSIEQAITNGAEVVVCPGFLFAEPLFVMQEEHPDVNFIMIDGCPSKDNESKTADNTYAVQFAEEQSGFFAGYAAVKAGYRKLGFMGGMAVPAVMRYGYGYVQGAEYAAAELDLSAGEIECRYNYTGIFDPSPEIQTMAASWYADGTEVIFSCGGMIINSIAAAAEAAEPQGAVIGVDTDQRSESDTVVTSAMKMLTKAVYDGLVDWGKGEFKGGQFVNLGVEVDAVGLPADSFQYLDGFAQEDYDALYAAMIADTDAIRSNIFLDVDEDGKTITAEDLAARMELVTVTVVG